VPENLYAQGEIKKKPTSVRSVVGMALLVVFGFGLLTLSFVQAPYVIERPGPVVNVLGKDGDADVISITGAKTFKTTGQLDLLTVSVVGNREQTPSWSELLWAWLDPAEAIVSLDSVFPDNQTTQESEAESTAMMEQSQQDAIAAALLELGYKFPEHIYIQEVSKYKPSSGKLVAGDYIKAIDGVTPTSIDDMRDLINEFDGNGSVKVSVVRDGRTIDFEIAPIKNSDDRWVLGIFVGTKFDFPVKVDLQLSDIGGPSGGMMFALGIYDQLTPGALTGGQHIAGTGTIDLDGYIGPIGGIRQKMYGAQRAGAKYFLAPVDNCNEVTGHIPAGLKVFSVTTFKDALGAVTAIGNKANLNSLSTCATK
jgi:PDZ domain-containing protein